MTTKITRKSKEYTTIKDLVEGEKFTHSGRLYMKVTRFTRPGGVEVNAVGLLQGALVFIPLTEHVTHHTDVEIIV